MCNRYRISIACLLFNWMKSKVIFKCYRPIYSLSRSRIYCLYFNVCVLLFVVLCTFTVLFTFNFFLFHSENYLVLFVNFKRVKFSYASLSSEHNAENHTSIAQAVRELFKTYYFTMEVPDPRFTKPIVYGNKGTLACEFAPCRLLL